MTKLPHPTKLLIPVPSSCDAISLQVEPDLTALLNTLTFYDKWTWDYPLQITQQLRVIEHRPQFTILDAQARNEIQASHDRWLKAEEDRRAEEAKQEAEDAA